MFVRPEESLLIVGLAYPSKSIELLAKLADKIRGVVRIVRGDQGLCFVCRGHSAWIVSVRELSTMSLANIFC